MRNQPPTAPSGDVNGDGLVNSADLAALAERRRRGTSPPGHHPCTLPEMGDFDGNDVLDD